jgi:hypothetical protein
MSRSFAQLSLKEIQEKYSAPDAPISPQILRRLQRDSRTGARKLYKALSKRFEDQARERRRMDAMLHFERLLWKAGIVHIAGPVVAAAVVFPPETEIDGIDDSKALDEETRQSLDAAIRGKAFGIGIGVVEVDEIDRLNIYHAGIRAMRLAVEALPAAPHHILVDSRTIPDLPQPQNSFDKGDGLNFSLAAWVPVPSIAGLSTTSGSSVATIPRISTPSKKKGRKFKTARYSPHGRNASRKLPGAFPLWKARNSCSWPAASGTA